MKMHVRLRWILIVTLLPFVLLGVIILAVKAYDLVRHDPAILYEYLSGAVQHTW